MVWLGLLGRQLQFSRVVSRAVLHQTRKKAKYGKLVCREVTGIRPALDVWGPLVYVTVRLEAGQRNE